MPVIKLGVFIVVATAIAAATYFGTQKFLLGDDDETDDRRAVAVQRGTLLDEVTATGSVSFPELESLRFDISGTVAEILVEEGDSVTADQPLILLDDVTISALESAVANSELALQNAGEDLAELLSGATSLESAIAESNLADARVASMNAEEDLAELLSGATTLESAIAESNLADARVASMNAASALAEFTSKNGGDSPATADAKDELTDANEAHADAIAAAEDVAETQDELVEAAQEAYDDSVVAYSDQITGWFGASVSEEDRTLSPTALIEKWGFTVDEIITESTALIDSPPDDLATPWNESVAWVWTHLTPYPILTNCDATSFTARCPSAEIDEAWDVKVAAEESLVEVIDDATASAKAQQVLIDAAQNVVKAAAEDVVDTINDTEINALAATLAEKFELEKDAESTVAELNDLDSINDTEINALAATLAEKIELEKDAESTVAELNDLDSLQIKLATAAVNEANATLNNAKAELAAANLNAPFNGVITSISVEIGDPVNRTTPTIDILDPSIVVVDGSIDEIDVLSVKVGDAVTVTLDALPDQPLEGVVDEIGDGVNQQGVIEFPLTVALTPPDDIELIEGLSATATIVLNQIDNALLVPLQAVGGSFFQATVDIVTPDGFVTTNIELGASDDFWVIAESGISEGQEVLMAVAKSVDPFQQLFGAGGGAIRIPGGAAPGPGGGGRGGVGGGPQ
ncbi:MAG TPA: HlyD family efflux transporter periplasmic adaptor subunit [Dehalococcoidia bacterium]|nr:HlyD family efflux transporter periplasmic adaptor subunit [Dehalococcoidia bacterium]HJP27662.1 HlyD family efflux transporter periplasmic adaptor subunit [Dehalococcoidia bacterium]